MAQQMLLVKRGAPFRNQFIKRIELGPLQYIFFFKKKIAEKFFLYAYLKKLFFEGRKLTVCGLLKKYAAHVTNSVIDHTSLIICL